jgi:hypothetical protein
MKFFDLQHPFYKPLWIRVLITAVCLGWTVVELLGGNVFWAILFGSVGVYAFYQFFIAFNPRDPEDGSKP